MFLATFASSFNDHFRPFMLQQVPPRNFNYNLNLEENKSFKSLNASRFILSLAFASAIYTLSKWNLINYTFLGESRGYSTHTLCDKLNYEIVNQNVSTEHNVQMDSFWFEILFIWNVYEEMIFRFLNCSFAHFILTNISMYILSGLCSRSCTHPSCFDPRRHYINISQESSRK